MSRGVLVAFDFGPEYITAQSRIGALAGPELCWEAPAALDRGLSFCATEEGQALVLEGLALMHYPRVETLVLALPAGEVEAHRAALEKTYTGSHDVRNTECRSQRLAVHVQRVAVLPRPVEAFLADAPSSP